MMVGFTQGCCLSQDAWPPQCEVPSPQARGGTSVCSPAIQRGRFIDPIDRCPRHLVVAVQNVAVSAQAIEPLREVLSEERTPVIAAALIPVSVAPPE